MTDSAGAGLPDFDVAPVERCHAQPLDAAETHYTVDVDGLTDPENVELTLAGPMASGWVAVDGGWDSGSLRSLAASVVRPGMTDEQKAWAIWELVGRITYRMSLHATSDPLELVNAYGYGYCSTVNRLAPALWQAAGLRARGVRLHGDYNCEVFFDGSWHLLSAYLRTYYPRADGDGAASAEELIADPGLVERNVTEAGGDAKEDVPGRALAAYFAHATPEERDFTATSYSPRAALRTRERLIRRWNHRGAWSHSVTEPSHYGNGELVFEPDLAASGAADAGGAVLLDADNVDPGIRDRGRPRLKPLPNGRPAAAVLRVRSPYPIVGGRLELYAVRTAPDDLVAVEAAVAGGELAEVARSAALGEHLITADLGPVIPRHHGSQHPPPQPQELRIRLRMRAAVAGHAVGVSFIRIVAGVQYHARVLPALRRGRNRVRFTAAAVGPGAQVVHRWRENHTLSWHPEHPYQGQLVTLRARVRNRGDAAPADPWDPQKTGVMVRFHAGEPRPENRIGGDQLIPSLAPGEEAVAEVSWRARAIPDRPHGGEANNQATYLATSITVVVDSDDRPGAPASMAGYWERREDNNACTVAVPVRQPPRILVTEPYLLVEPADRTGTVQLAATIRNACISGRWLYASGTPAEEVRVRWFDGDPGDGGVSIGAAHVVATIEPGRHATVRQTWHRRSSEPVELFVRVGPWTAGGDRIERVEQTSIRLPAARDIPSSGQRPSTTSMPCST